MTKAVKIDLDVDYSQVAVFWSGMQHPFNDWEERHVTQGFAWRAGSVSFRTLGNGPHSIDVIVTEHAGSLTPGAIRAIEVPFEVSGNGRIEIASISESVELVLPSGKYLLRSEMLGKVNDVEIIRLLFAKSEVPRFSILLSDGEISPDEPLLTSAQPAL
ncbi:competence protein ComJ [Sinorhizobium meliloti]|uniref:competence protein ComJ n=1 Tax=Rhizobium meliloti TaxID=382 RepID=UPI000FDB189E|nr:competence protein ComJ [Sinorhizobium meliloti]RVP95264.1 hypothetical protein CN070_28235 [Sinorhizobium meliloti]